MDTYLVSFLSIEFMFFNSIIEAKNNLLLAKVLCSGFGTVFYNIMFTACPPNTNPFF